MHLALPPVILYSDPVAQWPIHDSRPFEWRPKRRGLASKPVLRANGDFSSNQPAFRATIQRCGLVVPELWGWESASLRFAFCLSFSYQHSIYSNSVARCLLFNKINQLAHIFRQSLAVLPCRVCIQQRNLYNVACNML